jgi:hypothetical protein
MRIGDRVVADLRSSGGSAMPFGIRRPVGGRGQRRGALGDPLVPGDGGTISSTRRQSSARLPRTPSSVVQNRSARSRRTLRLSVRRVSPPVPGSTASSGTSGSDTAERRSSIR